jgi:hypothetical protein
VQAHEHLFTLIAESVFKALGAFQKTEKIGVLPLAKESRTCSGWADRGIPTCRALLVVKLDSNTLKQIEKSAPKEMLKGSASIYGSKDSTVGGSSDVSLRAATVAEELVISIQYVAAKDPGPVLAKKVRQAILEKIVSSKASSG